MSAFSSRSPGYKVGLVLLMCVTGMYLVGFGSPYWITYSLSTLSTHKGIWMGCTTETLTGKTLCVTFGLADFPVWFYAARTLLCLCTVGLCIACLYGLVTNCCRTFPGPRTRVLETLSILSGLLGFAGSVLYAVEMNRLTSFSLGWACYLAILGSGLSAVAGVLVAVTNRKQEGHSGGMVMTTVTTQPGYAPQPQGQGNGHPYPNNASEPYNPYSGNVTQPYGYSGTAPQPYMAHHQGYATTKDSAPY